jgi:hypothetical protein
MSSGAGLLQLLHPTAPNTASGESVVVCVEAKAGQPLGDLVSKQRKRAEKALQASHASKAVVRLDELLARFSRYPADDPQTSALP